MVALQHLVGVDCSCPPRFGIVDTHPAFGAYGTQQTTFQLHHGRHGQQDWLNENAAEEADWL